MSEFPTLEPAFTILVTINPPTTIGSASRQTKLMVVPMVAGTVTSEANFSPSVNGKFIDMGTDYIHADPDGKHLRLDAHSVIETDDGATIYLNYTGILNVTPELAAIFAGESESTITPWGDAFIHPTFETGEEKYQSLENSVFVAAGRFVYEKGGSTIVEYKVSKAKA